MAASMKIRPAQPEDVGIVMNLIRDLAHFARAPLEVEATEKELQGAFFCSDPKVFCDLVEVDGEVAGMAIWYLSYSTWQGKHGIYLEDLFIKPQFRGRGYGTALLKHLAKICDTKGYGRFEWLVLDWNSPAIEFYRSLGAAALDELTVYRLSGDALKCLGNQT